VSSQGDARPEASSSATRGAKGARIELAARASFAVFLALHFTAYAYRAAHGAATGVPGAETSPWLTPLALALWLPFFVYAVRGAARGFGSARSGGQSEKERALALAERTSLFAVLGFVIFHIFEFPLRLYAGHIVRSDILPDLVAALSGTTRGVPLVAIAYLVAVGASAFYASRSLALVARRLKTDAQRRKALLRAAVGFGLFIYFAGAYAVIRFATGRVLPW
jgi:hypothetical protein